MNRLIIFVTAFSWNLLASACEREARIDDTPENYAWFLRISFPACDTNISGIKVRTIHPKWQRASALREKNIPEDVRSEVNGSKIKFQLAGDFDGDKQMDKAIVGVYKTATDGGNFFLIITESQTGVWEKVFLKTYSGTPGFLGLRKNGRKLQLWDCMDCDSFSEFVWSKRSQKYVWLKRSQYE